MFLLITENRAFLEPYHFGQPLYIGESDTIQPVKLAEHIPLFEFARVEEKGTYEQLLGHFEYIFENSEYVQGLKRV